MLDSLIGRGMTGALPHHEAVAITRVAVLGAATPTGRAVVDAAARRGWRVRGATRSDGKATRGLENPERTDTWVVRFDDPTSLESVIGDCDAVLACFGPRGNDLAEVTALATFTRALVEAMRWTRVERLVCLSASSVRVDDERLGRVDRVLRALSGSMAPFALAARQVELDTLRDSDVAWTALRPTALRAGPAIGRYELSETGPGLDGGVSHRDAAAAMVEQVTAMDWICRAPFISTQPRTT